LFAHCVSLSVNAVIEPWNKRTRAIAHADQLARSIGFGMVEAGWVPTVENYLGRVTKARILQAVREAKGDQSAELIGHLKKTDMAREAERLMTGTGWLPEPLRLATDNASIEEPTVEIFETANAGTVEAAPDLPAFLTEDDDDASAPTDEVDEQQHLDAAE
jgi:ParB family chromosome partitioning protein